MKFAPHHAHFGLTDNMEDIRSCVLALGSAGFVGNGLCVILAELGHKVTAPGRSGSLSSDGRIVRLRGLIEECQLLHLASTASAAARKPNCGPCRVSPTRRSEGKPPGGAGTPAPYPLRKANGLVCA